MKKSIYAICLALAAIPGIQAQDDVYERLDQLQNKLDKIENEQKQLDYNKRVWGKGRFFRLGYAKAQTQIEGKEVEKSDWSFFLTKGTTYRIPSKPIAGMVKFGIDVTWFDLQVSKYASPYDMSEGWTSTLPDIPDDEEDLCLNIGRLAVGAGMGIGPSVTVAPFSNMAKGLQPLRATLYFHYAPTFSAYVQDEDEGEASYAFCNMMKFGGEIHYRWIGFGMEGRWGSGKFEPLEVDEMAEGTGRTAEKYKRKFASTRFYVQFTF